MARRKQGTGNQSAGKKKRTRATGRKRSGSDRSPPPAVPEAGALESQEPPPEEPPPEEPAPVGRPVAGDPLNDFFASPEELKAVRSMSLDLYRDELDARLRLEGFREYLSFVLADELFAAEIYNIKEIIKLPSITPVPRTAPVVLGVLSLRGTIAPVIDLRLRLGLGATPPTRKNRVLIVDLEQDLVGMLVEEVRSVIRLRSDTIEPPPAVFERSEAEHILGVGRFEEEMYTLLDLALLGDIERFILPSRQESGS